MCWGQAGDTQSSSCHFSLGPESQMLLHKGYVHLLLCSGLFSIPSLPEDGCKPSLAQSSYESAQSNRLERRMDEGDACARPLLYTEVIDVIRVCDFCQFNQIALFNTRDAQGLLSFLPGSDEAPARAGLGGRPDASPGLGVLLGPGGAREQRAGDTSGAGPRVTLLPGGWRSLPGHGRRLRAPAGRAAMRNLTSPATLLALSRLSGTIFSTISKMPHRQGLVA